MSAVRKRDALSSGACKEGEVMGGKPRQYPPPAWVSFSRMMKPEDLVAIMARLIRDHQLCADPGVDVLDVLLRCGAFTNVDVSMLDAAITKYLQES